MFRSRCFLSAVLLLSAFSPEIGRAQLKEQVSVGVSKLVWLEKIRISKAGKFDSGITSSSGFAVTLEKTWSSPGWGGGVGLIGGTGRSSAGGFEGTVAFADTGDRPLIILGALPRLQRSVGQHVQLGAMAPVLYRRVDWTSIDPNLDVEPRGSLLTGVSFEIRLTPSPKWEVVQSIGALGDGETFWKLGLGFVIF